MNTEDFAALGIGDELGNSVALAVDQCPRVAAEAELPDVYLAAVLAGLLLGESDRGNLRACVCRARHRVVIDRPWPVAQDRSDGCIALGMSGVRQHEPADEVA